jgi:hypothetical protein
MCIATTSNNNVRAKDFLNNDQILQMKLNTIKIMARTALLNICQLTYPAWCQSTTSCTPPQSGLNFFSTSMQYLCGDCQNQRSQQKSALSVCKSISLWLTASTVCHMYHYVGGEREKNVNKTQLLLMWLQPEKL